MGSFLLQPLGIQAGKLIPAAAKLQTQEVWVAWETQSYALPGTLDVSPALISLHLSRATKPLPQLVPLDLALLSPALRGQPKSHRWEPDRLNSPSHTEKGTFCPKATSFGPLLLQRTLASKPMSYLLSSKAFPGTRWLPPAFSGCPRSWGHLALISTTPALPSLHNVGRMVGPGNRTAFRADLFRIILPGNVFISFAVPCVISIKPGQQSAEKCCGCWDFPKCHNLD